MDREGTQTRECWAEEGTARAVRRDTKEVGIVQEWVKMRILNQRILNLCFKPIQFIINPGMIPGDLVFTT